MVDVINVHEAKTHLSRILERVRAGEEIVLAKAGKPYARLIPVEEPVNEPIKSGKRELGFLKGSVSDEFFEPLSEEELALWEGPLTSNATPARLEV